MQPVDIPSEWNGSAILTVDEFCTLARMPRRIVGSWRSSGTGPRFWRFNGTGRLYTTVDEVRRWTATTRAATGVRDDEPGERL